MGLGKVLKATGKVVADVDKTVSEAAKGSKTRLNLGALGARTAGQAKSLRQKIQQLDKIEDKDSEKARLLESAIGSLKERLPNAVVKKVMESLKPDMNKGGAVKKTMMAKGGMANGKAHMYVAGGAVMDNLTSAQRNMVKKMAAANKK